MAAELASLTPTKIVRNEAGRITLRKQLAAASPPMVRGGFDQQRVDLL